MKSWADHSDSEDEGYEFHATAVKEEEDDDEKDVEDEVLSHEDNDIADDIPPPKKVFDNVPDVAPFTAFVGNLAPVVDVGDIADIISSSTEGNVLVDGVRIMHDRETGRKKGFGYIEMKSRDDLVTLLALNGDLSLAGRVLRLDVATQRSNGSNGRQNYNRRHNRGGGRSYRNNSDDVDGSNFRGGLHRNKERERPSERPKIILQGRRSSDNLTSEGGSASNKSSIFGGGKPRDENAQPSSLQRKLRSDQDQRENHSGRGYNHNRRSNYRGRGAGRGNRHRSGRGSSGDVLDHRHDAAKSASKPLVKAEVRIFFCFETNCFSKMTFFLTITGVKTYGCKDNQCICSIGI